MNSPRLTTIIGAVALGFLGSIVLFAQGNAAAAAIKNPVAATPQSIAAGQEAYRKSCAPCHGVSGKGDGPAAAALNPKPADLTQFAKRRGGTFSAKDFEEKLNGGAMAPAHGSTAMPVWGPTFRQFGNEQLRVANLRKYVEALQVK